MKTVKITEDFYAFPHDKRRDFKAGEEVELANDLADLYVKKGYAREVAPPEPEAPEQSPAEEQPSARGRKKQQENA